MNYSGESSRVASVDTSGGNVCFNPFRYSLVCPVLFCDILRNRGEGGGGVTHDELVGGGGCEDPLPPSESDLGDTSSPPLPPLA